MTIGIIAAMSKEVALLKPLLSNCVDNELDGFTFHCGKIGAHRVIVMQCGIAKVNAAIGTVAMIDNYRPTLIINSGVAGGADSSVNVMDIVVGTRVAYHDVYCGPETMRGAVQGLPLYFLGAEKVVEKIPERNDIKKGLICTGDQFIDRIEQVHEIKKIFPDALAVDMESAAIAHVCELRHVQFLSLRVISDSPGASHDNTTQYTNFWETAPRHTFEILRDLLESL